LNIFERYLLPLSQAKVTTRFGVVCAWQYFSAAASSVPLEEPARMPSVFSSARGGERFAVGDAPGAVHAFDMGQRRNKVFANPSTSQEPASW
jgi:hypothetical protein